MSFGTSAGDIFLILKLTWDTFHGARQACGEHDKFTREVATLWKVLSRVHSETLQFRADVNDDRWRDLEEQIAGCEKLLKEMKRGLRKYNALSDDRKKGKRAWKQIRFGTSKVKDLREIRSELATYTTAISMSLKLYTVGSLGRVERTLDDQNGELKGIRQGIDLIAAKMNSTSMGVKEGSVWTVYENDDKKFWRDLRRQLNQKGFDERALAREKDSILAYVEALGQHGVFDDDSEATAKCGGPSMSHEESEKRNPVHSRDSRNKTVTGDQVEESDLLDPLSLVDPADEEPNSLSGVDEPDSEFGIPTAPICPCCFEPGLESSGSGGRIPQPESQEEGQVALEMPPLRTSSSGPSTSSKKPIGGPKGNRRRNLSLVATMLDEIPDHWGQRIDWERLLGNYPSTLILNWDRPGFKPLSWKSLLGEDFKKLEDVTPQQVLEHYHQWKDHFRLSQIFKGVLMERLSFWRCGQLREAFVLLEAKELSAEMSEVKAVFIGRISRCSIRELLESYQSDEKVTTLEGFAKMTSQELLLRAPAIALDGELVGNLQYLERSICSDATSCHHYSCKFYFVFLEIARFWYNHRIKNKPVPQLLDIGPFDSTDTQLVFNIQRSKSHVCNCQTVQISGEDIGIVPSHVIGNRQHCILEYRLVHSTDCPNAYALPVPPWLDMHCKYFLGVLDQKEEEQLLKSLEKDVSCKCCK